MGMMDARTNDSLAALQLLKGLPPDALEDVRAAARIRRVPRNARLFNQGDGPVRAHALIDGYIRISQSGSDGAQVVMRFIRPGDLFGSVALFTDGRYPADADALTRLLPRGLTPLTARPRHGVVAVTVTCGEVVSILARWGLDTCCWRCSMSI